MGVTPVSPDLVPSRMHPTHRNSRTSRNFNNLCIPFLFHDLNLLDNAMDSTTIQAVAPYTSYIRTIRLLIDPPKSQNPDSCLRYDELSTLISQCRNTTSLALYYNNYSSHLQQFESSLLDIIRLGKIKSLGIYSNMVLRVVYGSWTWNGCVAQMISRFLETALDLPEMKRSLTELDIVMEKISGELYARLRPFVVHLKALTIRRAFRVSYGRIWEPFRSMQWSPSVRLQRLNLIDCSNAYAPHIPELVGHFKSLRYLVVSTCGDETDLEIGSRVKGWSHSSDALCKNHIPLEEFHIEHMYEWEMSAMATIPTKKLITSRVENGQLIDVFLKDREVFPGLQFLSIESNWTPEDDIVAQEAQKKDLERMCRERSVVLSLDATHIKEGGVATHFGAF
jgi:hypothetical protein